MEPWTYDSSAFVLYIQRCFAANRPIEQLPIARTDDDIEVTRMFIRELTKGGRKQ